MRKTRENNQCAKTLKWLIINSIYSFSWMILDRFCIGSEYGGELAVFDLHRTIAAATAPRFDKLQQFIFHNTRFMQI